MASPLVEHTVTGTAHRHGIDVWRIGDLDDATVQRSIAGTGADVLVVACYNRLIPEEFYSKLPLGGVNLHPSLLPDKRGPDPLFWVFRCGDEQAGATVHRLTDRFDAGDILAQQSLAIPDGITEDDLDALLAELGAAMLVDLLAVLASAVRQPIVQDETRSTWAPHPGPEDWVIDPTWHARSAYNFVRGLQSRGLPILLAHDEGPLRIIEAHDWRTGGTNDEVPVGALVIPFAAGELVATVAPHAEP